jgi:cellulose synthase/poly-beta-1,6-N-acetylglucosamine synthase-like glycosyltransferase
MQESVGHIIWSVCYLSVLIGLSAYGVHRYFIIYLYLKNRNRPPVPSRHFEELPKVTVQLPIFNEVYVAERLIRSVSELDYPRELLEIQVLDDSTDETREITTSCAEELRQRGFNVQRIHRTDRTGFKAGALAVGLAAAEGEFLCILDADFVPQKDLLKQTIHFFTDPKVGMIQTRWGHLNRGYSLLTRMQAIFLDGHLLLEQTARSRSGRFFNFNGTAGLWRPGFKLSRSACRLEIHLSFRCRHTGGAACRHERLQISAASLDQGFRPDMQEVVAERLAEPIAFPD